MKNYFVLMSIILLLWTTQSFSQSKINGNDFIQQNLIISIEGGINYGFSDYKTSNFEPGIRGSIEYFPIIINNARLGLKLFGGGTRLSFIDGRGAIQNNDEPNPRTIPLDIYTDVIQIGGSVNFALSLNEYLISYLNFGAAYLIFSPKNSDGNSYTQLEFNRLKKYDKEIISFLVEGGLRYKLSDRFGLNLALGYYPTSTDYLDDISAGLGNDSFLFGLVGISYAISGNFDLDGDGVTNQNDQCPDTPKGIKVDAFGCPIDSDNDGVPDYLDKCLNTPPGISIDIKGCPIDSDNDGIPDYLDKCINTITGVLVDNNGCPIDSDADGVPDYIDKCLNTPSGIEIDSSGCPVDSDKDGVPDYLDNCSDTPINSKVDSAGCPENSRTSAETFYQFILRGDDTFKTNSDTLIELAKVILDEIANYIKSQSGSKWRIEGYMDNQGSVSFLKKLSYNRAKATLNYLVLKGLSDSQFNIIGLGDSLPIGNNNTPEGRSTNRRILIIREN